MKKLIYCALLICSFVSASSDAKIRNRCKATEVIIDNYEPEIFQNTNNLLRKEGQSEDYCGTRIVIKGKLLDEQCMPISDAKIYLWQVGCDGKYPYVPLRTLIDKTMLNLSAKSSFTGSGIATTNNLGEFYFITIFPKTSAQKPNVNIRVEHRDLGSLQTKVHLLNHHRAISDFETSDNDAPSAIYRFHIIMPGHVLKHH
jgi:protocatechuate 3,4-dioxygenase beta subunit